MSELVVILDDLFPPLLPTTQSQSQSLPRMPAFETLLARARREPLVQDWRVWLASRAGAAALAPAALLARAWSIGDDAAAPGSIASTLAQGCWLATPLHMIAGLDRVLLHPAGLLHLPAAEQQRLAEQFAQIFAGSAWRLHALGERELLLTGPPLAASGTDPARFLGADPSAGLPPGREAAPLRSLGSELELWLHEHPVNRDRAQRGDLAVTTLWLWGGGLAGASGTGLVAVPGASASRGTATGAVAPRGTTAAEPLRVYGSDSCAGALARLLGGSSLPLPAGLTSIAALEEAACTVVIYPLQAGPLQAEPLHAEPPLGEPPQAAAADEASAGRLAGPERLERVERLERLERRWLAPALSALRARRIDALLLVAADRVYHLDWPGSWRLWRARAPWWEVLG